MPKRGLKSMKLKLNGLLPLEAVGQPGQVLEALPAFTFEECQLVIRRAIELDDPPLSEADETLVESRLAGHRLDPTSSVPLETLKERLRSRTKE